jgi:hypothetical protein
MDERAGGVAAKIVGAAEAETIGYAAIGAAGFVTCFPVSTTAGEKRRLALLVAAPVACG